MGKECKNESDYRKRITETMLGFQGGSLSVLWLSLATKVGWLNLSAFYGLSAVCVLFSSIMARRILGKVDVVDYRRHNKITGLTILLMLFVFAALEVTGTIEPIDTYILGIPLAFMVSLAVYIAVASRPGSPERAAVERRLDETLKSGKNVQAAVGMVEFQRKMQKRKRGR